MNCPNCTTKMDSEDAPQSVDVSPTELARTGKQFKLVPGAHYYCTGCDSEWVWTRGRGPVRQIDGANYDADDQERPYR